ncbi:MAG: helix-turn-helix domain-containing protein [Candidatus Muirbacterium halophilum]|nr:helix-turn-helix domain-containing protein [Candidatus Muirbacterium halophilum]MCK9476065.1 helix-turn-helix domain-containing protein [Candidatus Muirbacterium halophilum]
MMPESLKYLPDKICKLRKEAGISQEEFGRRAELTGSYVSQVERGLIVPSLQSLVKIANIFGITFEELMKNSSKEEEFQKINSIKKTRKLFDFYKGVEFYLIYEDKSFDYKIIYCYAESKSVISFKSAIGAYGICIVNKGEIIIELNDMSKKLIKKGQFFKFLENQIIGSEITSNEKAEFTIFIRGNIFV